MKIDIKSLLKNKTVLYIVLFLAITNVLGYLMTGNIWAVVLFALSGVATTYFSKNMIVVLLVALVITSFFLGTKTAIRITREGMKNKKKAEDGKKKKGGKKDGKKDGKKKENFEDDDDDEDIEDTQHEAAKVVRENKPMKPSKDDSMHSTEEDHMKSKDKKNSSIDHQSTLEEAYDNLEKMLGSDGIRNMTTDTKKLAEKQKKLMDNIKNMEPMLQNATKMLEGLDLEGMGNITKMMGNVTNLTKKMGLM
jgi:hypothetical protein